MEIMTSKQALKMAKAKLECIERQTSGKAELCCNFCENCSLCYEQGNIGEQKEWLKMAIKALEPCEDAGEISDGYHTFNQLYHQRAILFATIVNQNKDIAWKSYKHSDGKYCFDSNGEWFIVGIDTSEGSYTYHYSKEYWNYFKCKELDCGKEWDGHTEEDVTRLLSLEQEPIQPKAKVGKWIPIYGNVKCSICGNVKDGRSVGKATHYCDFCGAKMEVEVEE
jgi:hypothetical protein